MVVEIAENKELVQGAVVEKKPIPGAVIAI
jgi:hypothetical protein